MAADEQGVSRDRYLLVPRTAVFARRGGSFLLLRGSPDKKRWAGLYNGVGGHLDRGEDALTAATREFREETGLEGNLWLCGTVVVDAGEIGVGLYVFTGEVVGGSARASAEGSAEWIPARAVQDLPTVADVVPILKRIQGMKRGDPPFSARSFYDELGRLTIEFRP